MTNTTNILRTSTRAIAASFAAVAVSLSISWSAHAQVQPQVIQNFTKLPGSAQALNRMKAAQNKRASIRTKRFSKNTRKVLKGKSPAADLVRSKGNAARQVRQNVKMRQMFNQRLANGQKGILKRPGAPKANKRVKFNTKPMSKGAKYRPTHHVKSKHVKFPGKSGKTFHKAHKASKGAKAARNAARARQAAKVMKASKAAKMAVAGTGVGAVVAVGAGMAGLDPVEMATLKATNPAEYNRRMRDLKKNPVKYVGKNIANNTKKAAQNVGKAGKKVGCGIGNAFKKKSKRKKC